MSIKELERILASDLNIGHYYLLNVINFGGDIDSKNTLINGWINALIKRNLILIINDKYELTQKGKEEFFSIIENTSDFVNIEVLPVITKIVNNQTLEQFSKTLHSKIIDKIKELTNGKANFRNPSGKMLNSSEIELHDRLTSFFKKYKNVDAPYDKIEKVILKYTEEAITCTNRYAVRILFFIWNEKNGGKISEMLERIENLADDIEVKKEIANTKQLF